MRMNANADTCAGVGDGIVSWGERDGQTWAVHQLDTGSGNATWNDLPSVIYQRVIGASGQARVVNVVTGQSAPAQPDSGGSTVILSDQRGFHVLWAQAGTYVARFSTGFSVNDCIPQDAGFDGSVLIRPFLGPLQVFSQEGTLLNTQAEIPNFSGEALHSTIHGIYQRGTANAWYFNGTPIGNVVQVATCQLFQGPNGETWMVGQGQNGHAWAFAVNDPSRGFMFGNADAFGPCGRFLDGRFYFACSDSASEYPQFQRFYNFTPEQMITFPPSPQEPEIPVAVAPFTREMLVGCFEDPS